MARFDIMPYASAHGGHELLTSFIMEPAQTTGTEDTAWLEGNIAQTDGAGGIGAAIDGTLDPNAGTIYLHLASSADIIQSHNLTSPVTSGTEPEVTVQVFTHGSCYVGTNLSSGDDTQLAVTISNFIPGTTTANLWVDDSVATMVGHLHGFDNAGDYFVLDRVLDTLGRNAIVTGQTTYTNAVWRAVGG